MKVLLRQVWSGGWMLFWSAMAAWLGWWMLTTGWYLLGHAWPLSGLALCLLAFVPLLMALHGVWLALLILLGRLNVRMAKRKFRNSLADTFMYARTGLWKE